jgi:hypothetical protein
MAFFWGLPRNVQYGLAILVAGLLTNPVACAAFLYLSFGFGAIAVIGMVAIVFGAPLWLYVQRPTEANREKRAHNWRVWRLCLIVHVGASAGLCRVMDHMPMSQWSSAGRSYIVDYVGTLFLPVTLVWQLADAAAKHQSADNKF